MNQTKDKIYLPHTAGLLATAAALGQTQLTSVGAPAAAVAFAGAGVHVQAFIVVAIPEVRIRKWTKANLQPAQFTKYHQIPRYLVP